MEKVRSFFILAEIEAEKGGNNGRLYKFHSRQPSD